MDPLTLIVRSVCREVGVESTIEIHRIQSRVQAQLAEQYGGERLRLYVPRITASDRTKRHRAILAEHAAGDPVAMVARRHGVSERWIYQILRAQRVSPPDAAPPWVIDRG